MNTNPKLKKLKERKDQIDARIKNIEAKEKNKAKKEDTRRKILIGAFYMEQMEKDDALKKKIIASLDGFLTRPLDRSLFELPEKSTPYSRPNETQKNRTDKSPIRKTA